MPLRIDQDHERFRQIVKGKIRQNLKRFITQGELLGRKGKDVVSVPMPQIEIPRFRFGQRQTGGVGQGDGQPGDPVGSEPGKEKKAGKDAGEHALEVDVTLDELAQILGEELELPHIEVRGKANIESRKEKYSGIRRVGPESLRHFKRTYREALKREVSMGKYDPNDPNIVPIRDDKRFRSWKISEEPIVNAVIIYMMDVSGSMGDEQKEIVRLESFWIDTWLRAHYKGLEVRYIIHDATAREVDQDTFFHTRESGGTMISSAYKLCQKIISESYPTSDWNIYPFHFSDGDNWSNDDTIQCLSILRNELIPHCNIFGYGQVESPYGSGQFIKDLREQFREEPRVILSDIRDRNAIIDSIKTFLGKGF